MTPPPPQVSFQGGSGYISFDENGDRPGYSGRCSYVLSVRSIALFTLALNPASKPVYYYYFILPIATIFNFNARTTHPSNINDVSILNPYVCMYQYVCTSMCVHVCLYRYVCMYICCMYVHMLYVCIYVVCMYLCCMYVSTYVVCMYVSTYVVCMYLCMSVPVCMYWYV